jgi:hypothetical protein
VLIPENLDAGEPLHEYFIERHRRVRKKIADAVIAGQQAGEIKAALDADLIASEALAFTIGMQIQWLLDPDEVRLTETYVHYTNDLVHRIAEVPDEIGGSKQTPTIL